jgi:3'(2'),5'-bisphosphate nucleotidase
MTMTAAPIGHTSERRALLEVMVSAATAASDIIGAIYAHPFDAMRKADGSPVTIADHQAEAEIIRQLAPLGLPILAEESVAAGRVPDLAHRWFCVDPLDGTKEFLARNGEFTVNIALIEHGRPVLGVVLAPATGATLTGGPDGALEHIWRDGRLSQGTAIRVRSADPPLALASRSHAHGRLKPLFDQLRLGDPGVLGSSLKFCVLARGAAQLYPRLGPTSEWDTAAGQAVLEAAGGVVLDLSGARLRYGKAGMAFLNGPFVAACDAATAHRALEALRALAPA